MTDVARALSRLQAGELAEAEAICLGLLSDAKQRPDALHILGMVAHQRGDGQAALRFLKDAVKADPRNGDRRLDLGMLAFEQGAYYDAVAHLEALIAGCGEVPQALNCLGNALLALGHPEQAVIRLERAVTAAPRWAKAWLDLARAYRAANEPMAAAAAFEGAYRQERDPAILLDLGAAYLEAGALPRALRVLKGAARESGDGLSWLYLGQTLRGLGHADRALKAHRTAAEKLPGDAHVQLELARSELRCGDFDEGFRHFEARKQLPEYCALGAPWLPDDEHTPQALWLYADGGPADTLMFLSYVPSARAKLGQRVRHLRVAVQPALLPLLKPWAEQLGLELASLESIANDDASLPLGSLPHLLALGLPPKGHMRYLAKRSERRTAEVPKLVGVHVERNNTDDDLAAWQALPWPDGWKLVHLRETVGGATGQGHGGWQALAERMAETSLVVTTDDTVANLASAMGKRTWLLVPSTTPAGTGPGSQEFFPDTRLIQRTTLKGAQESAAAIEPALQELET